MREIIQQGGDTDTNACIVGGMLGAFLGNSNIPKEMATNVLSYNCTDNGIIRPEFLNTKT